MIIPVFLTSTSLQAIYNKIWSEETRSDRCYDSPTILGLPLILGLFRFHTMIYLIWSDKLYLLVTSLVGREFRLPCHRLAFIQTISSDLSIIWGVNCRCDYLSDLGALISELHQFLYESPTTLPLILTEDSNLLHSSLTTVHELHYNHLRPTFSGYLKTGEINQMQWIDGKQNIPTSLTNRIFATFIVLNLVMQLASYGGYFETQNNFMYSNQLETT